QLKIGLDLPGRCAVRIGPEVSVRHTARLLGLSGQVDPGLATLDLGSWCGQAPEQISADELGPWFADPAAAPHGGETVAAFVARIGVHVTGLPADSVLVLAKPVVQGLLCIDASDFFATDIRPASVHRY
ncbi:MAG: histidine phosphatase family protein, partial [Gordonia sp. (in: high G+C Gram-positive bacteria)]|uniref:histidine phosphatase family protein n=1 Tax=Gordonia sp. (in: high G+C Gram-positive bacteria) TaxID=84139 RepID=UPI003BB4A638